MKKTNKQNGVKKEIVEMVEHTRFEFGQLQNAQNVALALCSAGFFVRILSMGGNYMVMVLKYTK